VNSKPIETHVAVLEYVVVGGGGGGDIVAVIEAENRAIGRNSTRPSVTGFDVRQRVLVSVNTGI